MAITRGLETLYPVLGAENARRIPETSGQPMPLFDSLNYHLVECDDLGWHVTGMSASALLPGAPVCMRSPGPTASCEEGSRRRDNHGMRLGCGKVFRDQAALDEYVTAAVFERFDSPEAARILALMLKEDEERAATLGQQLAGQGPPASTRRRVRAGRARQAGLQRSG